MIFHLANRFQIENNMDRLGTICHPILHPKGSKMAEERYGNLGQGKVWKHFNQRGMETFPKKGMETFRFFTATCYQTKNDTRPYIYIYDCFQKLLTLAPETMNPSAELFRNLPPSFRIASAVREKQNPCIREFVNSFR